MSEEERTSGTSCAHHPADRSSRARVQLRVYYMHRRFPQKGSWESNVLTGKNKGIPFGEA